MKKFLIAALLLFALGAKAQTYSVLNGVVFQDITGTSATLVPNQNVEADNASLVTLTLPASASTKVGDVLQIRGKGVGLWKVAQNASQIINFGGLKSTTGTGGYIQSNDQYAAITLYYTASNNWAVTSSSGYITDDLGRTVSKALTWLTIPILFQSALYNHTEGGSGSNAYGADGLVQTTGATGTSKAYLKAGLNGADDIGAKTMRFHARCAITTSGTDYKAFVGIGVTNESATPFAPVGRWIGIKIERDASGTVTVKGTSCDNSTESTATLSSVTATSFFDLGIDITSATVTFYINGVNKGSVTANIPPNLYYYYSSGVTNLVGFASSTALTVFSSSLEILSY